MRQQEFGSRFGFYTVLSILTLGFSTVTAGCGGGDSSGDDDSAGGTGSGGTGGTGNADAIAWSADGWIEGTENAFGIQGPWYSYNDCMDAMAAGLPCTVPDPGLVGPDATTGWSTSTTAVCTKGVAPKVDNDPATNMPAYSLQWGAGIAFDLANEGGTNDVKNDFNADAAGIRGFIFDISSVGGAPPTVRVNYKTKATGNDSHFLEVTLPVTNQEVPFSQALQGDWVTTKSSLTTNALESIQFQVYTNATAAKPFDFCVSNIRAMR
jgi:hypothetical protein